MVEFFWRRQDDGPRYGVRWLLWTADQRRVVATCFWLPGARKYRCSASIPVEGGVQLADYLGGTASAARKALERDWDKRSIGLFGDDVVKFSVAT